MARKNTNNNSLLHSLAKLGAKARLEQLLDEVKAIRRQFPDLTSVRRSVAAAIDPGPVATRKRKRKPMTAAQKRAVSARMKKYWAARRKAQG